MPDENFACVHGAKNYFDSVPEGADAPAAVRLESPMPRWRYTSNLDENGEEDCVEMYATGQWNDDSCYKRRQFFFVEYDA